MSGRRSGEAQAALSRHAGPMKHRNQPRGGARNEQADLLDEYYEEKEMIETREQREERLYQQHMADLAARMTVGATVYHPDDISMVILEGVITNIGTGDYSSRGELIQRDDGKGEDKVYYARFRKAYWKDQGQLIGAPRGVRKRELIVLGANKPIPVSQEEWWRSDWHDYLSLHQTDEWKFFTDRKKAVEKLLWKYKDRLDDNERERNDLQAQIQMWSEGQL